MDKQGNQTLNLMKKTEHPIIVAEKGKGIYSTPDMQSINYVKEYEKYKVDETTNHKKIIKDIKFIIDESIKVQKSIYELSGLGFGTTNYYHAAVISDETHKMRKRNCKIFINHHKDTLIVLEVIIDTFFPKIVCKLLLDEFDEREHKKYDREKYDYIRIGEYDYFYTLAIRTRSKKELNDLNKAKEREQESKWGRNMRPPSRCYALVAD